ncbi:MAG: hypothetical protein H0Z16_03180 [Thermodesulfobacterium sp.]|nr:hypothetical protein [Thermodesulfobacterium sp.]
MKYKIIEREDGKVAIFNSSDKQISDWWDGIIADNLLSGKSKYYIVISKNLLDELFEKFFNKSLMNVRKAIFHISGKQISKWWADVSTEGLVSGQSEYYIAERRDKKQAIFHVSGKQISEWWNRVGPVGLVDGQSEYYIVIRDDNKFAIFHVSGKQISEWWRWRKWAYLNIEGIDKGQGYRIYFEGLLKGQSKYYIAEREDEKMAIFDVSGNQISKWWNLIYPNGLVCGRSNYYVVKNENGKKAIFHISGKQVSDWWEDIKFPGLIEGESDYYCVENEEGKLAIFYVLGKQISEWWDGISSLGLFQGKSDYYLAIRYELTEILFDIFEPENIEYAIFHVSGKRISNWWKEIFPHGLISGESDYYVAKNKNEKVAIFHVSGKRISDWWDEIFPYGLIKRESDFYLVRQNEKLIAFSIFGEKIYEKELYKKT